MFWDAPSPLALLSVCLLGGASWLPVDLVRASPQDSLPGGPSSGATVVEIDDRTHSAAADAGASLRLILSRDDIGVDSGSPQELAAVEDLAQGPEINPGREIRAESRVGGGAIEASSASERRVSPQHQALRGKVRRVLDFYQRRLLDTRDNNCWELMHAIVGYGVHSEVRRGGPKGPAVNSIAWLCSGAACNGQSLMYLDRGRLTAAKGPKVQGHHGQFLAILAQSRVMIDYPILVAGRRFSVADLIQTEKLSCESGMELTFKLIAFSHYLDSDETWKNAKGEEWSIPRLIREEIQAPINGAPCGGTHRLMGLSYAVRERQRQEAPVDGEFSRAATYVNDFHRYTFRLQNRDGSFSTEWFKRAAAKDDLDRRLQTSGHILEWLAYSVPDEMLDDPRFIKAVSYLSGILDAGRDRKWSVGPLGHALHSLAIYEDRMSRFEQEPVVSPSLARQESQRREAAVQPESDAIESPASPPVVVPATAPRRNKRAASGKSQSAARADEDLLRD